VFDALRQHFRPVFLNRVDEMIIFDWLNDDDDDLKKIVEIQLRRLTKRLEQQKITLELSDAAKERLARERYDPVYGARPLKRAIQKKFSIRSVSRFWKANSTKGGQPRWMSATANWRSAQKPRAGGSAAARVEVRPSGTQDSRREKSFRLARRHNPVSVFWRSMAYVLIGGTAVGTVLTLAFLPALYAICCACVMKMQFVLTMANRL
jgi:hypothetical protein